MQIDGLSPNTEFQLSEPVKLEIIQALDSYLDGDKIEQMSLAMHKDHYQVLTEGGSYYVDKQYRYVIAGEYISIPDLVNQSEIAKIYLQARKDVGQAIRSKSKIKSNSQKIVAQDETKEIVDNTKEFARQNNQKKKELAQQIDHNFEKKKKELMAKFKQSALRQSNESQPPSTPVKKTDHSGYKESKYLINAPDKDGNPPSVGVVRQRISKIYNNLKDEWVINYPAIGEERAGLALFSDPTCGVCRSFHNEIQELNRQGITVKVLFFPRGGLNDPIIDQMYNAWCSVDQASATDTLYKRGSIQNANCESLPEEVKRSSFPVAEHYKLASMFSVRATPTFFTSNGQTFEGYSRKGGVRTLLRHLNLTER